MVVCEDTNNGINTTIRNVLAVKQFCLFKKLWASDDAEKKRYTQLMVVCKDTNNGIKHHHPQRPRRKTILFVQTIVGE
jgi:hypothetical protein